MHKSKAILVQFLLLVAILFYSIHTYGQQLRIDAGKFQSIYSPSKEVRLNGSIKGSRDSRKFQWRMIAGPSRAKIATPSQLSTIVSNLQPGEYNFELSSTFQGNQVLKDTVGVFVYSTANLSVPSGDNYPNLLGSNPGYYGPSWTDKQVYTMMSKAGCRSTRSTIPMFFFKSYGDSSRYPEFKYFYDTLGFRENVYFLYNIPGTDYPDQSEEAFNGERSVVPKGMYLPIWNSNGSINSDNTFAAYCYKSVKVYGKFFRYYEIWNEPDFTGNWGAAGALPGTKGNWWDNDPNSTDLYNLKAPAQYYVRMLRIAYEVIKRYQPEAIITLGGVGFPSFLHFVLRSTDNPAMDKSGKRGSKSAEYPLTGGAYFDGLSFHSYPQFYLKYWDFTIGNMGYRRNSDEAIDQTIRDKKKFEKILHQFGYDGKIHPEKPFICTEINIPRKQIQQDIGGIEVQRNFAWKTIAQAAKNNIKQVYWFVTAETADYSTSLDGYKLMGLFKNILSTRPGREELTEEGVANKSAQLLLQDFFYDASITSSLHLPPGIEGIAWKNRATAEVRFMLWAKTGKDLDEGGEQYYSFPKIFSDSKWEAYGPDYFLSKKPISTVEPVGFKLSGTPLIFVRAKEKSRSNQVLNSRKPESFAGRDTIIHQQFLQLKGIVTPSSNQQFNFFWDIVSVPVSQGDYPSIKNKNSIDPVIMGLQKGVYGIRFTAADQFGTFSSDTVWIGVDTSISIPYNHTKIKTQRSVDPGATSLIFENYYRNSSEFILPNRKSYSRK